MRRLWQVSVRTTPEAEEAVAYLLERLYSQPAAIYRDEKTRAATVTVYPERMGPGAADLRKGLAAIRSCGLPMGRSVIRIQRLPRENWAESWKLHFRPIDIGERLVIKPSWSRRRSRPGQAVIVLDPGLSFGTGHHPTTLFCLEQIVRLRREGRQQSFLDIGTGSGILALAAARLGYAPVEAWDNDPEAVRAARRNLRVNALQRRVRMTCVDLRDLPARAQRRYDVVCANLQADLLLAEAEKIRNLVAPGGVLAVAGILKEEFEKIRRNLRKLLLTSGANQVKKEWKSGIFTLRV